MTDLMTTGTIVTTIGTTLTGIETEDNAVVDAIATDITTEDVTAMMIETIEDAVAVSIFLDVAKKKGGLFGCRYISSLEKINKKNTNRVWYFLLECILCVSWFYF
ncbi:MAG: hypothetical protein ACI4R8_00440 [Candidatus Caccovivens sp.]